jgi:Kef-type K+ transport system membrane component KefB
MTEPDSRRRLLLPYVIVTAGAIALIALLLRVGERAVARGDAVASVSRAARLDTMLHVLLALVVIIVTARLIGAVFRRIHQPPVIGEVVGGILLGPSLLGMVSPSAYAALLPAQTAPFLAVIAQLGVILYMFIVGLHLDLNVVQASGRAALAISHASIVCPFVLGVALALPLYPLAGESATFTSFALFMGVSMSITAFPVLARILSDKDLHRTQLGMLALTCAAVDDVTAWCLLALAVGLSQASLSAGLVTIALTIAYIAFMYVVVRPLIVRGLPRLERMRRLDDDRLAVVFVLLLLSALATEAVGVHSIFGAFLLGAMVPHSGVLARDVTDRLDGVVRVLFLPAFFAFTGMRTQIGLLSSWQEWMLCLLIIAIATVGKFGGTYAAARFVRLSTVDSAALGLMMNTRGLVELIVLNVGLDVGAISPRLFTMLVIMALVTTFVTTPALDLLMRGRTWGLAGAAPADGDAMTTRAAR